MNQPERRAYRCTHKDHDQVAFRVFLQPGEPVPRCPDHGRAMERQVNLRYVTPDMSTPIGGSQTKGRKR